MKLGDLPAGRASQVIQRSQSLMPRAPRTKGSHARIGHAVRSERAAGARIGRSGALLCGVMLITLQACSSLGPNTISQGRPAYNEAIAATNAEQYLSWVVRMRYGLPTAQLAVSSVTANVRFTTSAKAEIGIGPESNYSGNLVPLTGVLAYYENPTITYVPLQGEKHLRSLMSPVPLEVLGLMLNVNAQPQVVLAMSVKRINGIPNADFYMDPGQEKDRRFAQLMSAISKLSRADKLTFFESGEKDKSYSVWIHGYLPEHGREVRELLGLLDINGIAVDGGDIVLPVVAALKRSTNRSIAIQSRSVLDIGRIASASVDVPEADRARGLSLDFPKTGLAGEQIRVRRAAERPPTAAAATRFRDWWYYISGDDVSSKLYFLLLQTLMSVQLSQAAAESRAPVLTVPVN